MSPRRGARLAALLVPALLLTPVAAHAASLTVDDASGDARAVNMGAVLGALLGGSAPSADAPPFLDAPDETSVDVARTTIDHARKRLTLTVQFRDLVQVDGQAADFRIFTPQGRFELTVNQAEGRAWADLYPLGPGSGATVTVEGNTVTITGAETKPCRTVRARYDLAADTLVTSVPTSCLGSPAWVQVRAGLVRTAVTPQADGSANVAAYVDDAFRSGISLSSMGRSQKVRRG
ncbi:hypothetical protein [Nocardioides zeicaulis]|uniref:Uncharacterized protein n=1 Tax=Nocardioides zeicaulis TaxID=1776857 RepID=A0ABV6DY68_9ACTN